MQCRACGMESRALDVCEWCKKPMPSASGMEPTQAMPAQPVRQTRTALTGEVIEEELPPAPPPMPADLNRTMPMSPSATMSQPVPTQAMPAMTATSPAATAVVRERPRREYIYPGERWEKFLAIGLPILLVAALLSHYVPGVVAIVTYYTTLFVLSLIMGALRAIPAYEDEALDVGIVVVITLLVGPLIAIIAYGIVAMVKQEWNPAIFALFLLNTLAGIVLNIAMVTAGGAGNLFALIGMGMGNFVGFLPIFVCFGGWFMSSFFRPLDE